MRLWRFQRSIAIGVKCHVRYPEGIGFDHGLVMTYIDIGILDMGIVLHTPPVSLIPLTRLGCGFRAPKLTFTEASTPVGGERCNSVLASGSTLSKF